MTTIKERPILFSSPMVRAILAGTKTQTRRIAPIESLDISPIKDSGCISWSVRFNKPIGPNRTLSSYSGGKFTELQARQIIASMFCPKGKPGDRLWVRENGWERPQRSQRDMREGADTWPKYEYDADDPDGANAISLKQWGWKRRPSIHMPRWASRITLEITGVRVERLQDMHHKADQFTAEGIELSPSELWPSINTSDKLERQFVKLWESINGPGSWALNPFVWVVEYKRA